MAVLAYYRANNRMFQASPATVLTAGNVLGLAENLQFAEPASTAFFIAKQAEHIAVGFNPKLLCDSLGQCHSLYSGLTPPRRCLGVGTTLIPDSDFPPATQRRSVSSADQPLRISAQAC